MKKWIILFIFMTFISITSCINKKQENILEQNYHENIKQERKSLEISEYIEELINETKAVSKNENIVPLEIDTLRDSMGNFHITNEIEWDAVLAEISRAEDGTKSSPKIYTLDIQANFNVAGKPEDTATINGNHKIIRLNGNKTISLNNAGILLLIIENQTLIIDGPILEGGIILGVTGINGGVLELQSGSISKTGSRMAAVSIASGTFIMNGGTIANNISGNGGGVCIWGDGIFIMNDGAIIGNSAHLGGGVYVYEGTFIMNGGAIIGNNALYQGGGGVFLHTQGYKDVIFNKTGGIIYGSNSDNTAIENHADDGGGHALFYSNGLYQKRTYYYCNATLGENDYISTIGINTENYKSKGFEGYFIDDIVQLVFWESI